MLQLIDTVCFEIGKFQRLRFHNERINRSRRNLLGIKDEINIEEYLKIPSDLAGDKVKCRIIYSREIEKIEYQKYVIKPVVSLKMIVCDSIEYAHKYADRSILNYLLQHKGTTDDILIIKKGLITDTSYSNIVFLKQGTWITPSDPLLSGTRREYYVQSGKIATDRIRLENLKEFSEARMINAMISLEQSPVIPIENIIE